MYRDIPRRHALVHLDEHCRVIRWRRLLLVLQRGSTPGSGTATLAQDIGDTSHAAPEALT